MTSDRRPEEGLSCILWREYDRLLDKCDLDLWLDLYRCFDCRFSVV